ncbi:unnamed protein product [Heterobilharzia americana]|nr:unnamed protein product [Heterobilharzia americana]
MTVSRKVSFAILNHHNESKVVLDTISMMDRRRVHFIVKVFIVNILQIFFSIFLTVLMEILNPLNNFQQNHIWFVPVLIFISIGVTLVTFITPKVQHIKLLNDFLLFLFTLSFGGLIACLSVYVHGIFLFVSWIMAIILSIIIFTIACQMKQDITPYFLPFLIYGAGIIIAGGIAYIVLYFSEYYTTGQHVLGVCILLVAIPISLIESQMLAGGRRLIFDTNDYILVTMFHWILVSFSYSGLIFQFLEIWFP